MGQQDLSIHELVTKIERGDIRLPEMQRSYVWKQTQVRDLMDSLYRGYPSGTILTWETDEEVATRDFAIAQETTPSHRFQLLLDGQQRLTSVSTLLRGQPVDVRDRKYPIDILFNLEHPDDLEETTEIVENGEDDLDADPGVADASEDEIMRRFDRMTFVVHFNKLAQRPHWVSVREVLAENNDRPFLEKAEVTGFDDPRYSKYTDRLKKLRDIKNYTYRVHTLDRQKSYEEVTDIFVRVNSLGVKLRSSDLALAQITAKWRDSLRIFQDFKDECDQTGFYLELAIHLKNLVAFATGQSRFKRVGSLTQEQLEAAWEDAKEGMRYALNFLSKNVGIESPALLSSNFIIITLAQFGHLKNCELTPEENSRLRYWVLMANAKGRYSRGSSETLLDQDLAAIRKEQNIDGLLHLLKTQMGRLEILPNDLENRNNRSAYFKTMFLASRKNGARDWQDQLAISLKHSGSKHELQFHHIFPQSVLSSTYSKEQINDMCNLAFISGKTNRRIGKKEPTSYLPKVIEKNGHNVLNEQSIPDDQTLWKIEAYEDFLSKRRELVAETLNRFLGPDPSAPGP